MTRPTAPQTQGASDAAPAPALEVIPLGGMGEIGKNITVFPRPSFTDEQAHVGSTEVSEVMRAVVASIRQGQLSPLTVEKINGLSVMETDTRPWVAEGARLTPKGLSIRA